MSKSQRFRLVQFRENRTSQESLRSLLNHARYDGVNRLSTAMETGGWSRSFGYDSYGNRWVSGASGLPLSGLTPTSNSFTSANQIYGGAYDLAGNQTSYSTYTVAYDAENRIRSVVNAPAAGGGWVNYSYDANGKRVIKQYSDGGKVFYVYL